MKNKMLRNGVEMPEVGFGTWKAGETDGFAVLSEAIRAGYRHIDTASAYHTEEAVGSAVAAPGSTGRSSSSPLRRGRTSWATTGPWPPLTPHARRWGWTIWTCT